MFQENHLIKLTIIVNCEYWLGTAQIKCEPMKTKRQHSFSKLSPSSISTTSTSTSTTTSTSNKMPNEIIINNESNSTYSIAGHSLNKIMLEPFSRLNSKEFLLQTFPGTQSLEQIDQILADIFDKNVADFGIFQYLTRPYNINLWLPTWLHFAAENGLKILTESLLNTAGSLRACFVCNSAGLTPIDLARKNNHTEIVNLLNDYLIEIDNVNKDLLLNTTNQHVIQRTIINPNNVCNDKESIVSTINNNCSRLRNGNGQTSCQTPKLVRKEEYPNPLNEFQLIKSISRNDRIGINDYQQVVHYNKKQINNKPLGMNHNYIYPKSSSSTGSPLVSYGLLKSKKMDRNWSDSLEDVQHSDDAATADDNDAVNKKSEQEPEPEDQEEDPEKECYYLDKKLIKAQQQLLMLIEQFKNGISIQTFGRLFADWELLNDDIIVRGQMSEEFRYSFNEIKKLCHLDVDHFDLGIV